MKVEKIILLERDDLNSLHDTIYEVYNKESTDDEIRKVWETLPNHIKLDAEKWGVSDSVVRDNIYEFLLKNKS